MTNANRRDNLGGKNRIQIAIVLRAAAWTIICLEGNPLRRFDEVPALVRCLAAVSSKSVLRRVRRSDFAYSTFSIHLKLVLDIVRSLMQRNLRVLACEKSRKLMGVCPISSSVLGLGHMPPGLGAAIFLAHLAAPPCLRL